MRAPTRAWSNVNQLSEREIMRKIKHTAALAAITAMAAVSTPGIASAETTQTSRPIPKHGAIMTAVCGTLGGAINGLSAIGSHLGSGAAITSAVGEALVGVADAAGC
jgi:hypothetical protein